MIEAVVEMQLVPVVVDDQLHLYIVEVDVVLHVEVQRVEVHKHLVELEIDRCDREASSLNQEQHLQRVAAEKVVPKICEKLSEMHLAEYQSQVANADIADLVIF